MTIRHDDHNSRIIATMTFFFCKFKIFLYKPKKNKDFKCLDDMVLQLTLAVVMENIWDISKMPTN